MKKFILIVMLLWVVFPSAFAVLPNDTKAEAARFLSLRLKYVRTV